ncbi:MAG: localization factor PodJL [Alphaproteobacteria bacterium]|nr:localization factor PodJL [Alphaproteobacteria bacterium]
MKHTLPWNVTGIPPEAREIARSAAGREGIPVGEWLTRRIISESARGESARSENGRAKTAIEVPEESVTPFRYGRDEEISHDRDDPAARFARKEAETDGAFRRIDDTLRVMARRLEASERAQTEAQRAMSSAAAEINAAARDQAQAFKLLTTRIDNVERQTDTNALRDAVRALHQGMSRLTDQIAKTASDSSDQLGNLTGNIEVLAGRIAYAREESQRFGQSVEDRFAAFDERIKEDEHRIALSLALEERLKRAEQNIASNQASNEILARLDARVKRSEEDIASSRASDEIVARLDARLKQAEQSIASGPAPDETEARLEARLNFAEERTQEALERHFASIGHSLEDIASRLEKIESREAADTGVLDMMRSLGARLDAAEKKNREALTDLEANLAETTKRIENIAIAQPLSGPLAPLPEEESRADSQFDLPPFPEIPLSEAADHHTSGEAEFSNQTAPPQPEPEEILSSEAQPLSSSPENYLDHARRAAQAAAEPEAERGTRAKYHIPFPGEAEWALAGGHSAKPSRRGTQHLAMVGLFLLLIASGYEITRNIWRESGVVALQLNRPAVPNRPSQPSAAAPGKAAGTSEVAASAIPAEEAVSAVNAAPPPGSPAASALTTTPDGGAATPSPAMAPTVQQAAAGSAGNAGAANLSRLVGQANSGDVKAALALGLKYANGDGVPVSDAEAMRWLQKAAGAGEPLAQYRLGAFFEKGRGVDADQNQALRWYGEAAKNGNRKAMHALGVANANGIGGKKNFPEAVRWFKTAAELGLIDSQFNLAVLYERGLGVQTSLPEAYKWYAIAAASGDSESKTRVSALTTQISAAERDAADRLAKTYKPQPMNVAANDGPPLTSN